MPAQQDEGRTFSMHDALMWEQRIEKVLPFWVCLCSSVQPSSSLCLTVVVSVLHQEEACFIRKPRRRRREQGPGVNQRLGELERSVMGKAGQTRSAPNLMKSSDALPNDIRALQRLGVLEKDLITLRSQQPRTDGLVPRLRFKPQKVAAAWVPGTQTILEHKPEFYLEQTAASGRKGSQLPVWEMPPAGNHPRKQIDLEPPQATNVPSAAATEFGSTGMRRTGRLTASDFGSTGMSGCGPGNAHCRAGDTARSTCSTVFRFQLGEMNQSSQLPRGRSALASAGRSAFLAQARF